MVMGIHMGNGFSRDVIPSHSHGNESRFWTTNENGNGREREEICRGKWEREWSVGLGMGGNGNHSTGMGIINQSIN